MQNLPEALFVLDVTDAQFKVATALYRKADAKGKVTATTEELSRFTGLSESTLTRAFRALETHGVLKTTRIRKHHNKFGRNVYQLIILESSEVVHAWDDLAANPAPQETKLEDSVSLTGDSVSLTDERSTAGQLATVTSKARKLPSKENKEILRISVLPENDSGKSQSLSKSESEPQAKAPKRKSTTTYKPLTNDPRNCRTRHLRPKKVWNEWDVTAEFADRLKKHFSGLPPIINQKRIESALRQYRSEYGTNALIELKLIDWLFEEERYPLAHAQNNGERILGIFLNQFKKKLDKARDSVRRDLEREAEIAARPADWTPYLIASDGRQFDRSIVGRRLLADYEARLKAGQPYEMVRLTRKKLEVNDARLSALAVETERARERQAARNAIKPLLVIRDAEKASADGLDDLLEDSPNVLNQRLQHVDQIDFDHLAEVLKSLSMTDAN